MLSIFVTGIGTGVGKTVVSAILCEALGADYWKPVQAGSLEQTDSMVVKSLLTNTKSKIHPEAYLLKQPMSPHAAAAIDGLHIEPDKIAVPQTSNSLVIEGAGGLMVPLNEASLMIDLIERLQCEVVLVSRNYLGSINHTLLSWEVLNRRRIPLLGVLFVGAEASSSESFIRSYTEMSMIGRIEEEAEISPEVVRFYAAKFKQTLMFLHRRKSL